MTGYEGWAILLRSDVQEAAAKELAASRGHEEVEPLDLAYAATVLRAAVQWLEKAP